MSGIAMPIIVLAAGASSRMRGRDKLLEKIDGVPLLRAQVRKALEVAAGPVLVALPPAPHSRYDVLEGLPVVAVPVADAAEGMNASLRAAFAALPRGATHAMVLLADLPDLTADDLRYVIEAVDPAAETQVWRGTTEDGASGHPIIFRSDLFAEFATLSGDSGGREVIARAEGRVVKVPLPGQRARRDLDTPEDWTAWRAARVEGSGD